MQKISITVALFLSVFLLAGCDEETRTDVKKMYSGSSKPFPESRFTEINGAIIHYRYFEADYRLLRGKLLMIHGLSGSTANWHSQLDFLTNSGYSTILVDLPGFGYSDRKKGYWHSAFDRSDILWQLLDQVDNKLITNTKLSNWTIAGHSMGARAAAAMALDRPEELQALIIIDGVFQNPNGFVGLLSTLGPVRSLLVGQAAGQFRSREKLSKLLSSAYGGQLSDELLDSFQKPLLIPGTAGAVVDALTCFSNKTELKLSEIRGPVGIFWGGQDNWVKPSAAYQLTNDIAGYELNFIPQAGHLPMLSHPEEFNRILLEFLNRFNPHEMERNGNR